jgi:hypothetical protein
MELWDLNLVVPAGNCGSADFGSGDFGSGDGGSDEFQLRPLSNRIRTRTRTRTRPFPDCIMTLE